MVESLHSMDIHLLRNLIFWYIIFILLVGFSREQFKYLHFSIQVVTCSSFLFLLIITLGSSLYEGWAFSNIKDNLNTAWLLIGLFMVTLLADLLVDKVLGYYRGQS